MFSVMKDVLFAFLPVRGTLYRTIVNKPGLIKLKDSYLSCAVIFSREGLIKDANNALIGVEIIVRLNERPEEIMKPNIALIGAGYWGKNHLRVLNQIGVLHTVVDKSDEVLSKRQKDFPYVVYGRDERKIVEDPDIEACVIAVPAILHYTITKQCLLAGKDVFVEKPLALKVREGQELVRIAQENKRVLMVGHILQYHTAILKLKQMVDRGKLGEIRYIYSNRLNIGKMRVEENVLWSFAPHDISVILMLMNDEEPLKVSAFGGIYVSDHIYDTSLTTLEFKNNVKSHIYVSWLHPFKEQKLVVVGSDRMAVFDDVSSEKLVTYSHRIDFESDRTPITRKAKPDYIEIEDKEPLYEELLHFIHCVRSRDTPRTDGLEGLSVLKVLERAEKSLEKRRDNGP
jgi:UDP-2-acetamido-3-amino-2,3-dideoxy-glucuronate N-acetyltransferase